MTTTHPPTTEAIVCPVWCDNHESGDPGGPVTHWAHEEAVCQANWTHSEVRVQLAWSEDEPSPVINVETCELDVSAARSLAGYLLETADLVERGQAAVQA